MLVKRDTPISGIFETDPEVEATDSSGVPTPRGVPWSNDHLTSSETLPVVTAKTEPTQRGLGIPPPPSNREVSWHSPLPAITSLSPLSLDAFEADAASPHAPDPDAAPTDVNPTENERITVRAPPPPGASPRRKRHAWGASFVAAAVLLLGLFARRATLDPEGASAAAAGPAVPSLGTAVPASPALLAAATATPSSSNRAASATPPLGAPSAVVQSHDRDVTEAARAPEPASDTPSGRRGRSRAAARAKERARTAGNAAGPALDSASVAEAPAPARRTLSLPPR